MGEKLVLLDGYSLMYRAFHALSTPMTAPDGTPYQRRTWFYDDASARVGRGSAHRGAGGL